MAIGSAATLGIHITDTSDINAAVAAGLEQGALIFAESDLAPAFFDLRTGLAGELLQKLANYRIKTAILVPDPSRHGPRFSELVQEHRHHSLIRIFANKQEANVWLGQGKQT